MFTALDPWEGKTCTPMSLNGYSWVEGNAINLIDETGMQSTFPSICEGEVGSALIVANYNRQNAATAGFNLAKQQSILRGGVVSLDGSPSAYFMSLAIYAGGFPMIKNPEGGVSVNRADTNNGDDGWHGVCSGGFINGNYVFRNHDIDNAGGGALISYLQGTGAGGNRLLRPVASTYSEFSSGDFVNADAVQVSNLRQKLPELSRYKQGDYIWIDTLAPNTVPSHGFLLVGFGPALKCDSSALNRPWLFGDRVMIDTESLSDFVLDEQGNGIYQDVPYVVDWGLQRNTARPFYCADIPDPINGAEFSHRIWRFYEVPDVVFAKWQDYYVPSFTVSSTGVVSSNC